MTAASEPTPRVASGVRLRLSATADT
jgi:hypothetical protein